MAPRLLRPGRLAAATAGLCLAAACGGSPSPPPAPAAAAAGSPALASVPAGPDRPLTAADLALVIAHRACDPGATAAAEGDGERLERARKRLAEVVASRRQRLDSGAAQRFRAAHAAGLRRAVAAASPGERERLQAALAEVEAALLRDPAARPDRFSPEEMALVEAHAAALGLDPAPPPEPPPAEPPSPSEDPGQGGG